MRLVARLIFFWLSVMLIAGCTFFQDKDEEILPAELVKYDEKIKIAIKKNKIMLFFLRPIYSLYKFDLNYIYKD